ncbi:lipase family protein [Pseudobythopirellula maris]|uniref:lipase family protein n=1 Tax=Pseudobythopirellula maris TaxID=2527991 RepID=UPI001E4279D8|nr:lipase family protein [Pseudobythopirellula maris]
MSNPAKLPFPIDCAPIDGAPIDAAPPVESLPPFVATSLLDGAIEGLTFLERSLLFAELSRLSYFSRAEAGLVANAIGFPEIRFYDRDGAQAYIFSNDTDTVVTCRGTEPNEWNDVRADLDAAWDAGETVGRVHRGFKREVDDLWPRLEEALRSNDQTLWFAGHSLGGAMAAICGGRCKLSAIDSNPRAIYTYGSPRVGNKRYINHVKLEYYRWVNNNDIVPRVPPAWLGYAHGGREIYLNRKGQISDVEGVWKMRDRFWGFWRSLRRGRVDHFSDHLMTEYIGALQVLVDKESRGSRPRGLERFETTQPSPPSQFQVTLADEPAKKPASASAV